MGFEQLAVLKQQLAMQAEAEKRVSQKKAPRSRSENRPDARAPGAGKESKPDARPARARKESKPDVDPVVITISRLQRQFPKAFPKKPDPKVPLKLGIHQELIAQADTLSLEPDAITLAIKTWCQGARYWACMVDGAQRIDLNGEPSGAVTAPEAQRARQLERRQRAKSHKRKPAAGAKPAGSADDTAAGVENALVDAQGQETQVGEDSVSTLPASGVSATKPAAKGGESKPGGSADTSAAKRDRAAGDSASPGDGKADSASASAGKADSASASAAKADSASASAAKADSSGAVSADSAGAVKTDPAGSAEADRADNAESDRTSAADGAATDANGPLKGKA